MIYSLICFPTYVSWLAPDRALPFLVVHRGGSASGAAWAAAPVTAQLQRIGGLPQPIRSRGHAVSSSRQLASIHLRLPSALAGSRHYASMSPTSSRQAPAGSRHLPTRLAPSRAQRPEHLRGPAAPRALSPGPGLLAGLLFSVKQSKQKVKPLDKQS
jgi:hypothetical protein